MNVSLLLPSSPTAWIPDTKYIFFFFPVKEKFEPKLFDDDEPQLQIDEEAEALELKSIKSELNLSDRTQIIKYEPNVTHGACKVEGSYYFHNVVFIFFIFNVLFLYIFLIGLLITVFLWFFILNSDK